MANIVNKCQNIALTADALLHNPERTVILFNEHYNDSPLHPTPNKTVQFHHVALE